MLALGSINDSTNKRESMKTILEKPESSCIAKLSALRVFYNNELDQKYYYGSVNYYEKGRFLFKQNSEVVRLYELDALADARQLALDNGFNN